MPDHAVAPLRVIVFNCLLLALQFTTMRRMLMGVYVELLFRLKLKDETEVGEVKFVADHLVFEQYSCVAVGAAVLVAVPVGVGVRVTVGVAVAVWVGVAVAVGVAVVVPVEVGVAVGVAVRVGVVVAVVVIVAVRVMVDVMVGAGVEV